MPFVRVADVEGLAPGKGALIERDADPAMSLTVYPVRVTGSAIEVEVP